MDLLASPPPPHPRNPRVFSPHVSNGTAYDGGCYVSCVGHRDRESPGHQLAPCKQNLFIADSPGLWPGPGAVCVWCNSHGPTHGPESNGNTESLEQRYISLCLSGPGLSPPGTLKALGPTQDWFSSHRLTQAPRHKRGKRPSITPISLALSAHLAGLTPLCASLSMSKSHKTA